MQPRLYYDIDTAKNKQNFLPLVIAFHTLQGHVSFQIYIIGSPLKPSLARFSPWTPSRISGTSQDYIYFLIISITTNSFPIPQPCQKSKSELVNMIFVFKYTGSKSVAVLKKEHCSASRERQREKRGEERKGEKLDYVLLLQQQQFGSKYTWRSKILHFFFFNFPFQNIIY